MYGNESKNVSDITAHRELPRSMSKSKAID
jgi:hypothetical protein